MLKHLAIPLPCFFIDRVGNEDHETNEDEYNWGSWHQNFESQVYFLWLCAATCDVACKTNKSIENKMNSHNS